MRAIHCVGVVVMDALSGPLEQYPVSGVQTQVNTDTIRFMPGGGAVNTASALARMGLSAAVFSKVGKDPSAGFLLQELEKCGVDATGIFTSKDDSTPFTFVGIHPRGDRTFIHTPGANKTFRVEDLDLERLLDTDFLLYQDLWALPALDGQPGADVLAAAQRRGVVTFLDECWGFGPERDVLEKMLPYCDYVLPSLDDMKAIYAGASPEEIATTLLAHGAKNVVLKMGAEGCLLAHGVERTRVAALPANVVDTTGAGDCWNAGFIAALALGENPVTAARIGNACAAFCIEAIGGSSSVPAYAAVQRRATK